MLSDATGAASNSQTAVSTSALTWPISSPGLFLRWTPTAIPW